MMQSVGHTVLELKRIRFGPLSLGSLPAGKWRYLRPAEVKMLKKAVGKSQVPSRKSPKKTMT